MINETNNVTGGIFNLDDIVEIDRIAKSNAEFEAEKEKMPLVASQSSEVMIGWDSLEE